MTHYWESFPSDYPYIVRSERYRDQPYLASTGLYMDVFRHSGVNTIANAYANATLDVGYGYGDYVTARRYVTGDDDHDDENGAPPPMGIIVGTFELSVDFWTQRNVLGRLLAIRMGVSTGGRGGHNDTDGTMLDRIFSIEDFNKVYLPTCMAIFDGSSIDTVKPTNKSHIVLLNTTQMCHKAGLPLVADKLYQKSWKGVWGEWKKGLCDGLTVTTYQPRVEPTGTSSQQRFQANVYYWENLFEDLNRRQDDDDRMALSPTNEQIVLSPIIPLEKPRLRNATTSTASIQDLHVGISLDLVHDPITLETFKRLLHSIQPLGFNLIQLRLSDDFGQVVEWQSIPDLSYSHMNTDRDGNRSSGSAVGARSATTPYHYGRFHLEQMVDWAKLVGIKILPEINLATNGGGWFKGGMLMNCPQTLCETGEGIAIDVVSNLRGVLPVVLGVIREMREIFSTTPFLHLGSDERRASEVCFKEAGYGPSEARAALFRFETKLASGLSLMGVDQSRIIRWQNQEGRVYPNRTGIITHFVHEMDISPVDGKNIPSTDFFGTVTVTNAMMEWDVFEITRRWIALKPVGLVLRTSSGHTPSLQLLVAFALGLDTTEIDTKESFQLAHAKLCSQLRCHETHITSIANAKFRTKQVWKDSFLEEACLQRTANVTVKIFKSSMR
jgi:hypothetical protein